MAKEIIELKGAARRSTRLIRGVIEYHKNMF